MKLSAFHALPPTLGGKRELAGRIFGLIDRVLPRRHWTGLRFVDGFMGGGAIAICAKALGFDVTAVDIAKRSFVTGKALLENSRVRLTREDVLRVLVARSEGPGPVSERWVPSAFAAPAGLTLDAVLRTADRARDPYKAALLRLLGIRLALTWHPMSQPRGGTAHRLSTGEVEAITPSCVATYVKQLGPDFEAQLLAMAVRINRGVFAGRGKMIHADIMEVLPRISAHVMYADPPYAATVAYEREYELLDAMLGEEPRPPSAFSGRGGSALLDDLIQRASHIPIMLISYGNAELGLGELEVKLAKAGRVTRAISVPYAHKASVARQNTQAANREFLVIGVDPQSTLPLRLEGAREEVAV